MPTSEYPPECPCIDRGRVPFFCPDLSVLKRYEVGIPVGGMCCVNRSKVIGQQSDAYLSKVVYQSSPAHSSLAANQPVRQAACQSVGQSVCRSVGRSVSQAFKWSTFFSQGVHGGDQVKLAFVLHMPKDEPVAAAMIDGALHAAADQKVALEVLAVANSNAAKSLADLSAQISRKDIFGIVATVPNTVFAEKLKSARANGIKVISVGASIQSTAGAAATDLFVGVKPQSAGKLGGLRIKKTLVGLNWGEVRIMCLDPAYGADQGLIETCQGLGTVFPDAVDVVQVACKRVPTFIGVT